eukprot:XP_020398550.1 uncharacterized protein LOC109941752 [Zea mays]
MEQQDGTINKSTAKGEPPNGSPAPFACARGAVAQPPPPLRVGPACKPRGRLLFIPYPYDTPFLSPHCSRRSKPPPSHPFVRPRATVSPISSSSLVPPLSLVCGWRGRDARRPRRPRHPRPRPRRRFAPARRDALVPARLGLDAAATPASARPSPAGPTWRARASARPNPGPRPRPPPCVRGVARPALDHGAAARGPPVSPARSGVRSPALRPVRRARRGTAPARPSAPFGVAARRARRGPCARRDSPARSPGSASARRGLRPALAWRRGVPVTARRSPPAQLIRGVPAARVRSAFATSGVARSRPLLDVECLLRLSSSVARSQQPARFACGDPLARVAGPSPTLLHRLVRGTANPFAR